MQSFTKDGHGSKILFFVNILNSGTFPGGSVVKNSPGSAGDTGSIIDPERSLRHKRIKPVHHNYWVCVLEPRSRNSWAHLWQILKSILPRALALQEEKPRQWEACSSQPESKSHSLQLEKSPCSNQDPVQPPQINKWIKIIF